MGKSNHNSGNRTGQRPRKRRPGQKPSLVERNKCRQRFLEALAELPNIVAASEAAGIARSTAYYWLEADENFRRQAEAALQVGGVSMEAEAMRRGIQGWDEPVYWKGKVVGAVRKYSDRMLEILLRGHMPWKYRPNWEGEAPPPPGSRASAQATANVAVFNIGGQVKRPEEMTEAELAQAERALGEEASD